jgi:predicted adenine nucleotide alpha hydrolase (AANH) superfamily ATPase
MKILLHSCCAPCGAYVIEQLQKDYDVAVYFCNLNIHPEEEYERRKMEIKNYCEKNKIEFIEEKYNPAEWFLTVKGLEKEPERGRRCLVCFKMRLGKTAELAKEKGFDCFTTTLTISPHKDTNQIFVAGKEMEDMTGVKFLARDWKLDNGFKCSCDISKEQGFYRQKYCGCVYSQR